MHLHRPDWDELLNEASSAAVAAGHLILEHRERHVEVALKAGGNTLASQVVTEVDQKSEQLLLKRLQHASKHFGLGLLTEEREDNGSRLHKEYFWCIDPLDGTLPFTEGKTGYAVSIALVSRSGVPELGVVYDPVSDTLYSALKGRGAFRNGQEWRPELDNSGRVFSLIFDRSMYTHPAYEALVVAFSDWGRGMGYQNLVVECFGGAVMNALRLLETGPGAYFKFPKAQAGGGSLWDFAATACIYIEAGALARDFGGNALALNPELTSFMNHCGVMYTWGEPMMCQVRQVCQSVLSPV